MTAIDIATVRGWANQFYAGAPGYVTVWNNPRRASLHVEAHDADGIATAAAALAGEAQDVYLGACTLHRRPAKRGGRTDVGALLAVWADLDVAGPTHRDGDGLFPHDDDARSVLELLLPPTAVVHSGGGLQAWWLLNEPWLLPDGEARNEAEAFLHRWGVTVTAATDAAAEAAGQAGQWKTDLSVYELARVMRPPGTFNHKAARADAGLRRPAVYDIGGQATGVRYSREELAAAFAPEPVAALAPPSRAPAFYPPANLAGAWSPADYLNEHVDWSEILTGFNKGHTDRDGITYWTRPGKNPRDGHSLTTREDPPVVVNFSTEVPLPVGGGHKLTKLRVYAHLHHRGDLRAASKALRQRWPPTSGSSKVDTHRATTGEDHVVDRPTRGFDLAVLADGFRATDVGNAARLASAADGRLRFAHAWGKWLVYIDGKWVIDAADTLTTEMAKRVAATMFERAVEVTNVGDRDALLKWAKRSESVSSVTAMIRLARGIRGLLVDHRDLDANPMLLNVLNGTVDLRSGKLRDHDPDDLLTMQAPVVFDADAQAPLWNRCVELWQPDADRREYLHRAVGSGVTGHPVEHFFVNLGRGANGKGKYFGAIGRILGEYYVVPHKSLLVGQRHEQHDTIKAKLFRSRMVVGAETENGDRLDEGKLKDLTGGDPLEARRMREDPWPFLPSWTMFLHTNYRPRVSGTDEGIWRRVRLIHWTVMISPEKRDPHLADKLANEASGILNYLIDGCLAWQAQGLAEPTVVLKATADWRAEDDLIGRWLEEGTVEGSGNSAEAAALHASFAAWCLEHGEDVTTPTALGQELGQRGFRSRRVGRSKVTTYFGLALTRDERSKSS